jgi:tetratricopeptide (TPR) repeat protein
MTPPGWQADAHRLWTAGRHDAALHALLTGLNAHGRHKPTPQVLQWVYYLCLLDDWAAAAQALRWQLASDPDDRDLLYNLAVCCARSGQPAEALAHGHRYAARYPDDPAAWDVVCSSAQACGLLAEAAEAGTRALMIKDRQSSSPAATPSRHVASGATADVIAFSLWGRQPTYLHGALDNLLAAPRLYPGWQVRIYLDDSVPPDWQALLRELGADLRLQPAGQITRQKLCWRFQVANDPGVHRFLVRDIDSVLTARERAAVDAWIASGRSFHIMRDWWTHTDLMLAGMWGGIAGRLPALDALLATYRPAAMETPNVDQWFLRDRVWPLLRDDCLVHDRCFRMAGSLPWPTPDPPGTEHVGQDEHAADPQGQAERLKPWLAPLGHAD